MIRLLVAALCLSCAERVRAQGAVVPSVQASFGSVAMSSGTRKVESSGPQIAAAVISNGAQAIQSGFFAFLEAVGISATTATGQTMTQTVYPLSGAVTITVPAGAVGPGTTISLSIPTTVPRATDSQSLRAIPNSAFQIDCGGCQPAVAVSIDASYASADLAGNGADTLVAARYDDARAVWVPLVSSVNSFDRKVLSATRHFSIFQLMASVPQGNVNSVRAIPNPFVPRKGHTAMGFFNLPSSTRVRIYTYSGELIKDLTANAAGLAIWDGTNTYGAKVGSGVYYAFVQGAHQARTITVAVQR
jgi:hypothetical protein